MKLRLALSLIVIFLAWTCELQSAGLNIEQVRTLRLAGQLQAAQELAERVLALPDTSAEEVFGLHLELARIHDRYGLHFRRRPVEAALAEIDKAASMLGRLGEAQRAEEKLARATYYYRAEMSEREFPIATGFVEEAIAALTKIGDLHGQAEAVHLRGLIHLQKRELEAARQKFDESLELDVAGGARLFFLGEYERHVAFVYIFRGEPELAIPHLERSLEARKEAEAIDASLFAANTLAGQYLAVGDIAAMVPALDYAGSVLELIDSPYAAYQFLVIKGRYQVATGQPLSAMESLISAAEAADSINWPEGAEQAKALLTEIRDSVNAD